MYVEEKIYLLKILFTQIKFYFYLVLDQGQKENL